MNGMCTNQIVARCELHVPVPTLFCVGFLILFRLPLAPVYVVGLPMGILITLWRRRSALFGPDAADNLRRYGFLYVHRVLKHGCP